MRQLLAALKDGLKNNLSLICDLIILNLLFIVCSIPIVTMGAAAVACYSSILRILRGEPLGMVFGAFFRDFRGTLKKGILGWLVELVCLALIAGDFVFAVIYSEPDNIFFVIFASLMTVVVLFSAVWFYPLMARFENKLSAYFKNSLLMSFAQFPRTLLAFLVQLLFLAIPYLFFNWFAILGWFWLLFGFSLPMYWTAKILRKSLQCMPLKATEMAGKEVQTNEP